MGSVPPVVPDGSHVDGAESAVDGISFEMPDASRNSDGSRNKSGKKSGKLSASFPANVVEDHDSRDVPPLARKNSAGGKRTREEIGTDVCHQKKSRTDGEATASKTSPAGRAAVVGQDFDFEYSYKGHGVHIGDVPAACADYLGMIKKCLLSPIRIGTGLVRLSWYSSFTCF